MEQDAGSAGPRTAVVLAAGEGSRLRPLTERVPKPLLPIGGEPVLGRVLDQLRMVGVERVVTVVGYHASMVEQFVREHSADLDLAFVHQGERRGTGDALQLARAGAGIDEDVAGLVERARGDSSASANAVATMALLRWPVTQLPHGYAVRCDDRGNVLEVLCRLDVEAPDAPATALSGSPLYVLRREFWPYVDALAPTPSGVVQLADALQQAIDDGKAVGFHEVHEALDLTRPVDLLRANFPYLRRWLDEAISTA